MNSFDLLSDAIPGSITATQGDVELKVKEKLKYSWERNAIIITGFEVFGANPYLGVSVKCAKKS